MAFLDKVLEYYNKYNGMQQALSKIFAAYNQ
jgi:hypothetical protein